MAEERTILHSDMNAFYASVEQMLNPELRGKAVAVCGAVEERHGIVLAKSEAAKRAGVKTGMVNWEARQVCPDLILVPPQYEQYLKYSALARGIYGRYTDLVEPFGMDECWLDITRSCPGRSGQEVAEEIRQTVKRELGLTVSIGVSFTKVFAKLGSDMKKPDAVTVISTADFREKIWPLDAGELIYVGRATVGRLAGCGIRTIGELANADPDLLRRLLGINGLKLWRSANGADGARVMQQDFVSPVKSVGHGITCVSDLETAEEVRRVMLSLAQDVGHRLRVHGLTASGVQIAVRGTDLGIRQYQCRLPVCTQLPCELAAAGFELFRRQYRGERVRALTIRAIELFPQNIPEQLSLFIDRERRDRRIRLEDTVEEIRRRFGTRALSYAVLMGDLKMPDDGRELVRMPGQMYQ